MINVECNKDEGKNAKENLLLLSKFNTRKQLNSPKTVTASSTLKEHRISSRDAPKYSNFQNKVLRSSDPSHISITNSKPCFLFPKRVLGAGVVQDWMLQGNETKEVNQIWGNTVCLLVMVYCTSKKNLQAFVTSFKEHETKINRRVILRY